MNSRRFSVSARVRSFRYAFRGIRWLIREEHNSWIYLVVIALLIPQCIILHLSRYEWIAIILCIALVFAFELVNSAIERLADKISQEQNPVIGKAKDLAAAAVLITAIASAVIGLIILVPRFILLVQS
jgi:diacylglycerol kinase (ATP)